MKRGSCVSCGSSARGIRAACTKSYMTCCASWALARAARPLCDLFTDLAGEPMSLPLLQQEIRTSCALTSGERLVDEVIARLIAHGFRRSFPQEPRRRGRGRGSRPRRSGFAKARCSAARFTRIVVEPCARRVVHETARGWLDIDGGIYVDVRQHAAGTDSER